MKINYSYPALFCGLALVTLINVSFGADPPRDVPKGVNASDFKILKTDVFPEMDKVSKNGALVPMKLSPEEIQGRNDWNLWTGGSQAFLERMARKSFGIMDVLKMLDSRKRDTRFSDRGLINEPGFVKATKPDKYGLWIDVPEGGKSRGFVDELIAKEGIDEMVYGRSTGILGLRLYPNPDFDKEAEKKWDAEKYYNDEAYAVDPKLIRPYSIGMNCGICHIAHHPLNPPANPEAPEWENLASAIGNQYFREGKVFANNLREPEPGKPNSFLWEMVNAQPAGTSDTSRIATDHINNPNAINAIFNVPSRFEAAATMKASEKMSKATLKIFGDNVPGDSEPNRTVPHILKDGADSIGVPGATIRVYINIGMYSQYWLGLHKPLMGVFKQEPFVIEEAQKHSAYWMATQNRLGSVKAFLSAVRPMHLKDAPGGADYLTADAEVMNKGKAVFAKSCAHCHSSKWPDQAAGETWTDLVMKDDFLDNNFLSNDKRIKVSDPELATNAGRALATNATKNNVWDSFSSDTYKSLPSAGSIEYLDPFDGSTKNFKMPAGGRGYYRVPSLIGIWTSAPFLHNNGLGVYTGDSSVAGRMIAFNDAAEKLLMLKPRAGVDSIWRTTEESNLEVQLAALPEQLRLALKLQNQIKGIVGADSPLLDGDILSLGPIPKGTPINLLGNLDLRIDDYNDIKRLIRLIVDIKKVLIHIEDAGLNEEETTAYMQEHLAERLLEESNCPDFVVDRGHSYGTELPKDDRRALIEFMKTF